MTMRKNNNHKATRNFDSYKPVSRKELDTLTSRVNAIDSTILSLLATNFIFSIMDFMVEKTHDKKHKMLEEKTAELEKKLKDLESKTTVEAETAADAEEEK